MTIPEWTSSGEFETLIRCAPLGQRRALRKEAIDGAWDSLSPYEKATLENSTRSLSRFCLGLGDYGAKVLLAALGRCLTDAKKRGG